MIASLLFLRVSVRLESGSDMKICSICGLDQDGPFLTGCFSHPREEEVPSAPVWLWKNQDYGDMWMVVPLGYRFLNKGEIPRAGDLIYSFEKTHEASKTSPHHVNEAGFIRCKVEMSPYDPTHSFPFLRKV